MGVVGVLPLPRIAGVSGVGVGSATVPAARRCGGRPDDRPRRAGAPASQEHWCMTTARSRLRGGGWPTRCTRWPIRSRSGWVVCAGGRAAVRHGCGSSCRAVGSSAVGGCTRRGCRAAVSAGAARRDRRGGDVVAARRQGHHRSVACARRSQLAAAGLRFARRVLRAGSSGGRWRGPNCSPRHRGCFCASPARAAASGSPTAATTRGESVRVRCLRVSEAGCTCLGVWCVLGADGVSLAGAAVGLCAAAGVVLGVTTLSQLVENSTPERVRTVANYRVPDAAECRRQRTGFAAQRTRTRGRRQTVANCA